MKKILVLTLIPIILSISLFNCTTDVRNRREVSDFVNDSLNAVLTLAQLKKGLDTIVKHAVFRGDSVVTGSGTGTQSIDFEDVDCYRWATFGGDVTFTVTNIQDGEVKYLWVNKNPGDEVRFSNVTDQIIDSNYVDNQLSDVYYLLYKKNGTAINAKPLVKDSYPVTTSISDTIVQIGDWDMDGTSFKTVSHGKTLTDIRRITVMIRNDANSVYKPITGFDVTLNTGVMSGGVGSIGATSITLYRTASGDFDNTSYNQTSYNRGYVIVETN